MKSLAPIFALICAAIVGVLAWNHFQAPLVAPAGPVGAPAPVDVAALRARADTGEAAAQAALGRLYAKGDTVTNDYAAAATWFGKAAAQGNPEGQLGLGELYEAGRGVARDMTEALKLYRLAAEQGYAPAEYTLAFMYEAGRGLPANQTEAAKWYQRAAEHGDALAQYDLGQRYDLGLGVATDKVEALKWLILAAAQGQADAAARLKLVKQSLSREQVAAAERRAAVFSSATAK